MLQVSTVAEFRATLKGMPRPIGLVPTMGAIHRGHLSLVERARTESATVVATIFVNPRQFGVAADLDRYPRPIENDLALLELAGVDLVFTPATDEMYQPGFTTTVYLGGPALNFEASERPNHFDGVATVVAKLLLQSLPDSAYFGRKDAQQLAVVRQMVRDLNIPVEIAAMPTIREHDGLAISSRNAALNEEHRRAAPALYLALSAMRDQYRSGMQDPTKLEEGCRALLAREPLIDSVDYVGLVDDDTFALWNGKGPCLLIAAVRIGGVRLIDNVVLD
jgi:pantoate--beta-alanine ligase